MTALKFYGEDHQKTLFPMETNRFLIEKGELEVKGYLAQVLDPDQPSFSFLSQTRVYAAKPKLHLRRTVKLDFVAEYYLYDLVFRERSRFRKAHSDSKRHFGYRFENGQPLSPSASFKAFKGAISANEKLFKHSLSFDIASYFNSIYHHDLVSWLANTDAEDSAFVSFGQFLREINSGRSIDCLPQGLYPAKMIGNDFLRTVEEHHGVRSNVVLRFMDDFCLFSNSEQDLQADFIFIQKLLGEKGLSVNPNKTISGTSELTKFDAELDKVKTQLLKRRREMIVVGYDEDDNELTSVVRFKKELTGEELSYLTRLLSKPDLDEDDAELVLTVMRENSKAVHDKLPVIARDFPHLAKNVYSFSAHVDNREFLAEMVLSILKDRQDVSEYQLFWFGWMLQAYLLDTVRASELIERLFNHPHAGMISQAKILEIADKRYGLTELRDSFLGAGRSDWLSWASAIGHRALRPISRNHKLTYFAKASPINELIHRIVTKAE